MIRYHLAYDSKNQRKPVAVYARAYVYFMLKLDVHDLVSFSNRCEREIPSFY